jgi:hypothetical protein
MKHLPWVQNGPVGFEKEEKIPYVKSNICAEI